MASKKKKRKEQKPATGRQATPGAIKDSPTPTVAPATAPATDPAEEKGWARRRAALLRALQTPWIAFTLVFLLALVLRFIHLAEVVDSPFFRHLDNDLFEYDQWANQIAEGDWAGEGRPVFYLGPLYPYFLAVIYTLFGRSPLAACIVQAVLSALCAGLITHLTRRLFGAWAGLVAGVLAAGYGMFILYTSLLLNETLILFLDVSLLCVLISALEKPAWWKWLAAGSLLGLSAAGRGNIAFFVPVVALVPVLAYGLRAFHRWMLANAAIGLATLLLLAPVTLHNWLVGDDLVLLTYNDGANFFIGNNANSDGLYMRNAIYKGQAMGLSVPEQLANFPEVAKRELGVDAIAPSEISKFWNEKGWEQITEDIPRWLKLELNKLRYFLNAYEVPNNRNYYFAKRFSLLLRFPLASFGLILPLSLAGLVLSWRERRRHFVLFGFVLAHLAALLLFFVNDRYRMIVVPALLPYAAWLICWLVEQYRRKRFAYLGAVAACLLVGYLGTYASVTRVGYRADFVNLGNAYRDLGEPERAIWAYDKSLEVSPDYYYALFKKGQVLVRLQRNAEAAKALRRALPLARQFGDELNARRIQAALDKLGSP